jgi:hypothetical protein
MKVCGLAFVMRGKACADRLSLSAYPRIDPFCKKWIAGSNPAMTAEIHLKLNQRRFFLEERRWPRDRPMLNAFWRSAPAVRFMLRTTVLIGDLFFE